MRWERALPHIPGKLAEFLPYLHCSLKSVQRSQPAVPGKRITFNNQHVFQSKLMLLAAMSPAPRCSCNCPLQHRAVAKQLWQAGFLRAGLPLLGTVSKSKPVPLPWWTAIALWLEQGPWALVPGSRAVGRWSWSLLSSHSTHRVPRPFLSCCWEVSDLQRAQVP